MFVRDEMVQLQKLNDNSPNNTGNYKTLKEIDLGVRCEALLTSEPLGENEKRFQSDCKVFLAELCG